MQFLSKILLLALVLSACKNKSTPVPATPDAAAILKHKYWVAKPFNDALFAENIVDTLSNMLCSELIFMNKDTLLLTSCLSDAGVGVFKVTGANTLEIVFDGFEGKPCKTSLDEKTGVLHVALPEGADTGWPTDFVAQDGIDVNDLDNVTISLARKRLAGSYTYLTKKGEMAPAVMSEFHVDGTQVNFGDFDKYEPWPSGIGGGFIQNPQLNLMYFVKNGKEDDPIAVAWQVHKDTLRIWETTNVGAEGDLPEYRLKSPPKTYLKAK